MKYMRSHHVNVAITRAKEDCCNTCLRLSVASQDPDLGEEEEDLNIPKVIGVSTYSRSAEINSEIDYKELKYQLFAVAYRGTNTEHFLALFNLPSGIYEYHGMIAEGALRLIKNDRSDAFTPNYINARDSLYKAKIIWYIR